MVIETYSNTAEVTNHLLCASLIDLTHAALRALRCSQCVQIQLNHGRHIHVEAHLNHSAPLTVLSISNTLARLIR